MSISNTQETGLEMTYQRWLHLLPWFLVAGLLLWLYGHLMISMVQNWMTDENYSHGFLVPIVTGGLIWAQRRRLPELATGPNWAGLAVMILGLLILLVGQAGHEFFLSRVSLIPVLWGLVLLAWGWQVARSLAFAFAYLVFMIPLPYVLYDSVAFPLRLVAASIAGWMIRLWGTPVLVEGNTLQLPNTALNVVDACSGIRSLISLAAVGVILAYLFLPNRWLKILLVAMVPPVAVLTNALRVAVAGLLAESHGQWVLEGAMHDLTGWLVFMAGFLILCCIAFLMRIIWKPRDVADAN
jgi:exosortase